MESEIKICGEEIALFKSVSKKSKKWYRDYGFEEIDNANTLAGKWARCPSISWTLCLSMMDDNQYTSFQVSGKVPKPPTAGELAMDL